MKIDNQLVSRLSQLAKLEFSAEAQEQIKSDLENILVFFEKINELPTEGIEPLVYMNEHHNVLRADSVKQLSDRDTLLKNAPFQDGEHILVPKVIDQEKS